jgi:hypothetical protein
MGHLDHVLLCVSEKAFKYISFFKKNNFFLSSKTLDLTISKKLLNIEHSKLYEFVCLVLSRGIPHVLQILDVFFFWGFIF